jgi:NADPH-dependent 2,4-dienoyl-CoA reductase/sulfur reductase-like enzyme/nitrite reductase/ring-hydroxylating ferredoxin subunit
MEDGEPRPEGPDLTLGVQVDTIPTTGVLAGRVGDEPVLLARRHGGLFAVSGRCTHYGAPLAEGLVTGVTIRCPWHHACFDIRTGEAISAPAIDPLQLWSVEVEADLAFVRRPLDRDPAPCAIKGGPERVVIVGGGAAAFAAAEMLRRRGHAGSITMISAEATPPCDRPNLSKDFLAGQAPDEWLPLNPPQVYGDTRSDLLLGTTVAAIDRDQGSVLTDDGRRFAYDALLLATGAEPTRPDIAGFAHPSVRTLRSETDARKLVEDVSNAKRVAVVGAGFIGLEVAAALRRRNLEVHAVGQSSLPLLNVLGPQLAGLVKRTHEEAGVVLHLGTEAAGLVDGVLELSDGTRIEADLLVVGVGVRPRTRLAEAAGLSVDDGIVVDAAMRTSAPAIWAAGDVARFPDGRSGSTARVEHWAVAEHQGQLAALSMLGQEGRQVAPFFWSRHHDLTINYVGHAEKWDRLEVDGDIDRADATVRYYRGDLLLAVAPVGREMDSLEAQRLMDG